MTWESREPWVEGIWSKWASNHDIPLPPITPITNEDKPNIKTGNKLLSKAMKERLEHSFSLTLAEFMEENDDGLPAWARSFKFRYRSHDGRLTSFRDKELTGYILKKTDNSGYLNRIHDIFRSSGYVITPDSDMPFSKLVNSGVSCVEKELLRSRKKRLLVFRFLNDGGGVIRLSTIRWNKGDVNKQVLVEENLSQNKWEVVKETTTELKEDSKGFDRFILSL